ncbi:hypothetical protein BDF19DRAFT_428415 [Syncephalis fuscata]|nr:hypothetical protein BDF19DRAFT_428415 [Syncephalis fuscata]
MTLLLVQNDHILELGLTLQTDNNATQPDNVANGQGGSRQQQPSTSPSMQLIESDRNQLTQRIFPQRISIWDESQSRWVPNAGSCARDVLANERTFLAWFRVSTSIFFVGISMCVDFKSRIYIIDTEKRQFIIDRVLGIVIMAFSLIALVLAINRYARVAGLLTSVRQQLPSRGLLNWAYLAMAISVLITVLIGLFWKSHP